MALFSVVNERLSRKDKKLIHCDDWVKDLASRVVDSPAPNGSEANSLAVKEELNDYIEFRIRDYVNEDAEAADADPDQKVKITF